jgi:hypothetical protein
VPTGYLLIVPVIKDDLKQARSACAKEGVHHYIFTRKVIKSTM